jgi:hypothetical protein
MQRIVAVVGLVAVGCGGEVSSLDGGAEADAWTPPQCEAGSIECAGPLESCGRRTRTCSDEGTWNAWDCTTDRRCTPPFCLVPNAFAVACDDPSADCNGCPTSCTIATDAGANAGACH